MDSLLTGFAKLAETSAKLAEDAKTSIAERLDDEISAFKVEAAKADEWKAEAQRASLAAAAAEPLPPATPANAEPREALAGATAGRRATPATRAPLKRFSLVDDGSDDGLPSPGADAVATAAPTMPPPPTASPTDRDLRPDFFFLGDLRDLLTAFRLKRNMFISFI